MNKEEPITIVGIDDHPLFRKGSAHLIAMDESLRLVGEASDGREGIEVVKSVQPDLVLLDLTMKGMDGISTLKALRAAGLDCRVVMLTVSDNEEDVLEALRAGADGYLLKDSEPEEILERLHQVAQGRTVLSETVAELLARALRADLPPRNPDSAGLTQREREILVWIAEGLSNKRIARQLHISEATVKVHVKHLLKKIQLRSRVEAAVWAVEHGLARLGRDKRRQ